MSFYAKPEQRVRMKTMRGEVREIRHGYVIGPLDLASSSLYVGQNYPQAKSKDVVSNLISVLHSPLLQYKITAAFRSLCSRLLLWSIFNGPTSGGVQGPEIT